MRYLPILFALFFAAPAFAACANFSTVWPACTVQFSSGEDLEDAWAAFPESPTFTGTTTVEDLLVEGVFQIGVADPLGPGPAPDASSTSLFVTSEHAGIVNFLNGAEGQSLVVVNNGHTVTYDCTSSNLKCGPADITTVARDVLEFILRGGIWHLKTFVKQADNQNLLISDYLPLAGGTMTGEITAASTLVGNCATTPCLDGSVDGGTLISLYNTTSGFKASITTLDNKLTEDASFSLLKPAGGITTTDFGIPVINWGTTQNWAGAQSFNNDAVGTKIKKLLTNLTEPRAAASVMIYGASTVPGHNFVSVGGTVIFNASLIATEQSSGSALTPGQGEYYVKDDAPSAPGFKDDALGNHVLAYLDDNVFTGTQEIQDDLFYVGDGSGIPYGSMYNHDVGTTVNIIAQNTPTQIPEGFTQGEVNLATFGNAREITVEKAGRYAITWQISFTTASANQEIEGCVMVDGTADLTITAHRKIGTATDTGSMSATGILDLAASAVVSLAVTNESSATVDVDIEHANLTLTMVGGT